MLEGKLAFSITKRTTAAKTGELTIIDRRRFDAHHFVPGGTCRLWRRSVAVRIELSQVDWSQRHNGRVAGGWIPCSGANVGRSGLAAGPYWRRRRADRASGAAEGTRPLSEKGERRLRQKSLLSCHGCDAPPQIGRWQIGGPLLRYLRGAPVFSCDFRGSRQRPRFEECRFPERKRVREELWQCDGFIPDDRRRLRDG